MHIILGIAFLIILFNFPKETLKFMALSIGAVLVLVLVFTATDSKKEQVQVQVQEQVQTERKDLFETLFRDTAEPEKMPWEDYQTAEQIAETRNAKVAYWQAERRLVEFNNSMPIEKQDACQKTADYYGDYMLCVGAPKSMVDDFYATLKVLEKLGVKDVN